MSATRNTTEIKDIIRNEKARLLAECLAKFDVSSKQLQNLSFLAKSKRYVPQNGIDAAFADCEVRNIIEGKGNKLYKKLYPELEKSRRLHEP